jgi:hypothetical protein
MQLVLVSLVAAALVSLGDAADVRSLIRQKLMAGVGATCGGKDAGPLLTMCTAPSSYITTVAGGCTSSQVPLYSYNASNGMYAQYCGPSTCTYSDTIKADANVGGYPCTGNKNVKITVPGVTMKSCTPCLDAKMTVAPEDTANMAACGLANDAFGCAVDWTVGAANTVSAFFTDCGNAVASGTTAFFNSAGASVTSAGNAIASGATNVGNSIASGAKSAAKSAKKFFKGR